METPSNNKTSCSEKVDLDCFENDNFSVVVNVFGWIDLTIWPHVIQLYNDIEKLLFFFSDNTCLLYIPA